MRLLRTAHFDRSYSKATKEIQQAFDKQSLLLLQNLRYPSLRAKKVDEINDVWQARVTGIGASSSKSSVTPTSFSTFFRTLNNAHANQGAQEEQEKTSGKAN